MNEGSIYNEEPILKVKNLVKFFDVKSTKPWRKKKSYLHAVDGVSFEIYPRETVGLVGESGCGKSTVARTVTRLIEPTSGQIEYKNKNLCELSKENMRQMRQRIQIIFQDPFATLNPRMTIRQIIGEAWVVFPGILHREEQKSRLEFLIKSVGLHMEDLDNFPHQFSGGQRQRVGIARALSPNPEVLICDEPVSALDVSIQAQILNLLKDIQKKFNLSYLFISHNLSVVRYMSNRVIVMYLGKIVEEGSVEDIYDEALHPYTQALLSARPIVNRKNKINEITLRGEVSSPVDPPNRCRFAGRCWKSRDICFSNEPELVESKNGHKYACFFPEVLKNSSGISN